ncbi:MAG: hypothetical protein EOP54_11005 [Sphingobacteriales bacterium]|nr:MAG: hypothetical protein EOP54_11005 [Sphingobacteriales bacterium]
MQVLNAEHTISISAAGVRADGQHLYDLQGMPPAEIPLYLYKALGLAYPKFFKMDRISKLGFVAAELLMQIVGQPVDKDKVALLLTTADGCREIDEQFTASMEAIPSPALFVYTLPNIVAGEICIRNGFKGEQMVWVAEAPDEKMTNAYLQTLFAKGNTDACLAGYLNAYKDDVRAELSWVRRPDR